MSPSKSDESDARQWTHLNDSVSKKTHKKKEKAMISEQKCTTPAMQSKIYSYCWLSLTTKTTYVWY